MRKGGLWELTENDDLAIIASEEAGFKKEGKRM